VSTTFASQAEHNRRQLIPGWLHVAFPPLTSSKKGISIPAAGFALRANLATQDAKIVACHETFCVLFRLIEGGEDKLNVAENNNDNRYKTTARCGRPAKPFAGTDR
jgi:hypothetical protein